MSNVKPERLAELDLFKEALDEWGCTDPKERAATIEQFLSSDKGVAEYIDLAATEPMGSA
jgi:hypothetical protein